VALACVLGVPSLAWVGYRSVEMRRIQGEMERAKKDFEAGNLGLAWKRLSTLQAQWPGLPEVEFRLGVCEQARGRSTEALAAWSRVPRRSAYASQAADLRANELINLGRYSPAEAVLDAALVDATGSDAYQLVRTLSRLYRFEGRVDDVRRLLQESWPDSPDRSGILKELWLLDYTPVPVEALDVAFEHADADDDRVWLGRAYLATLTSRFSDADRWLRECLRRRPDDPVLWQAKLDLARASGDVAVAWETLSHLPANRVSESELLSLRAWLAAHSGAADAERRALERLVEKDPGQAAAWERLAELAARSGRDTEAQRFHREKAKIDQDRNRLRTLVLGDNPEKHAQELASLSESLGRMFDARGWATLAERTKSSDRSLGKLSAIRKGSVSTDTRSLVDLCADLRALPSHAAPSTSPSLDGRNPRFVDDAESAGLRITFDNGQTPQHVLPETMSGGVAVLDFDRDGWLDVFVLQGGPLTPDPTSKSSGDRLFRNNGDGRFRDVTEASHISSFPHDYSMGVAVGDIDNDGDADLFITRLRSYALYLNRGDGTFEDATERAGLSGVRDNPSSAAFADLDGDGDLDLYVCHYMLYDPDHPVLCEDGKGSYLYCDPSKVIAAPDHLFRNDGGRFVDITESAGIVDRDGRGLGVVASDFDDDGKIDLFVANDGTAKYLFRNLGGLRFQEVGHEAGVAGNAEGGYQASMGIAYGDYDGDGKFDLLVTNFYGEASALYQNLGGGFFTDQTAASGVGRSTRYLLGFGAAFLDVENRGRLDLLTVNGHVNDSRPFYPYAMPAQLLAGVDNGRFVDISKKAGAAFPVPRVGRGLALGDLDNDGRIDALIVSQDGPLAYFHNRTEKPGHYVTLLLEGTRSGRDAIGTRVTVSAGGRSQAVPRFGGGSYLSASDPRLHFGLGEATQIDEIEVRWPSGTVDHFRSLNADTGYRIQEAAKNIQPLKGFLAP
jgi:enediyne biosynthesis protein E4